MRFILISLLAALSAVATPTGGRYKVDSFSGVDSVNIGGVIGSFSGGALGFLRMNSAATDFEFVVPSGTGVPANVRGATFLGKTIMDTAQINTLLARDTSSYKPKMTADTLVTTYQATFSYATASTPARFDGSKRLVSGSYTGTGSTEVLSNGPTINALTTTSTANIPTLAALGGTAGNVYTPVLYQLDATQTLGGNVLVSMRPNNNVTQGVGGYAGILAYTESATGGSRATGLRFYTDSQMGGGYDYGLEILGDATVNVREKLNVTGKITGSDTVVATLGVRATNFNAFGTTATFGGKIVSSDTVAGVGLRGNKLRVNSTSLLADSVTMGSTLRVGGYVQSGFLRTSVGAGVRLTMSDSGGVLTPNTAGAGIRGSYTFADTLNANRMTIGTTSTLQDANASAVRVVTTAAGGGKVSGVSSRLSFTGTTSSIAAAFRARVLNSDGDAGIVTALYVDTLQQGSGGSSVYSIYSPGTAPAYISGGVTVGATKLVQDSLKFSDMDAIHMNGNNLVVGAGAGDGGQIVIGGESVGGGTADFRTGISVNGTNGFTGMCSAASVLTVQWGIITACGL